MKNRYSTRFFLKQAFQSFWRNGVMSFASVAVLMSCLVVLGAFALLVANINENLGNIAKLNVIMVYCEYDADEEQVKEIEEEINKLPNVANCEHITKEESLEVMKEQSGGEYYDDITAEKNPFCDSFEVTYEDPDETKVNNLEKDLYNITGVRKLNSAFQVAKSVDGFKSGIMLVFSWFLVMLFIVSIFVIINTIKLSVYARRHEITVMRYVGATNTFITMPFLCEGVIIGVIASLFAFGIEFFLYNYIGTNALGDVEFIYIISTGKVILPMAIGFVCVGIFTGIIGSVMSLRKYLKS